MAGSVWVISVVITWASSWDQNGMSMVFWLVVTGTMEFQDFPYIGNNHPNWLSYFQRARSTTNQFSDVLISIDIPWWSYNAQVASHQLISHLIGGLADGTSGWSFSRSNQIIYLFWWWNRSTQHARVWIRLGVPMTHNIYHLNIFCTKLLNRPKFEVDPFPPGSQHHSTHSSRELRRSPWRFFLLQQQPHRGLSSENGVQYNYPSMAV